MVRCPPNCRNSRYRTYGDHVYTDFSSICQAAIHNGRIISNLPFTISGYIKISLYVLIIYIIQYLICLDRRKRKNFVVFKSTLHPLCFVYHTRLSLTFSDGVTRGFGHWGQASRNPLLSAQIKWRQKANWASPKIS